MSLPSGVTSERTRPHLTVSPRVTQHHAGDGPPGGVGGDAGAVGGDAGPDGVALAAELEQARKATKGCGVRRV